MKRKVLLQLFLIALASFTALAFLNKVQVQQSHCTKHCKEIKCCHKNQSDSSSDNIFFNPLNRLVTVVYK
jgi:hypothetical protein